jgi:hypothetical protein
MDDETKDEIGDRLSAMGIEAGGWTHELDAMAERGAALEDIARIIRSLRQAVQRRAACASDKKLYNVTFRYANVLASDQDEAIEDAEAGYGDLVERRASLAFVPEGTDLDADHEEEPSELTREPPVTRKPDVDREEFLRLVDELCMDPVTGETLLPDYMMVSTELYTSLARDPSAAFLQPGDELTFFQFPVRVVPHEELKQITGSDEHVAVFDRRRTLEETVTDWDGPDEAWEEAVRDTIDP